MVPQVKLRPGQDYSGNTSESQKIGIRFVINDHVNRENISKGKVENLTTSNIAGYNVTQMAIGIN